MIRSAGSNPTANAAQMFPAAARANRPIFYDRQGNARTVAGVYNELVRRYQVALASPTPGLTPAVAESEPAPAPAVARSSDPALGGKALSGPTPVRDVAGLTQAFAAANVQPSAGSEDAGPVFHSLFNTEDRRGAVAPVVAELWGTDAARAPVATTPAESRAGGAASPLDLFQNMRPNVRGLFDGSA